MADVFEVSNGHPGNYDDGSVEISVNGNKQGRQAVTAGVTVGQFLTNLARANSIRTYSAFADGRKLDTTEASKPMAGSGIKSVELVAKDSRGLRKTALRYIWTA